jgi:tetratricopeptide (TPR) repeat protein
MLETVREFASEELQASGEVDAIGRRHADWCLRLARASAANLADAGGDAWLTALVTEQANLRAALAWLRDRGHMGEGLRLAVALGGFWRLRSTPTEGRRWLEVFLTSEARASVADAEWGAALQWAGELAGLEGDMVTAEQRLAESLATARRVGDRPGVIAALAAIGSMAVQQGDIATCLPVFEEAATLARELGAHRQAAFLTAYLAFAEMHRGHLDRADSLLGESAALLRKLGDVRSFEAAFTALMEGWLAVVREDHERASQVFERCDELSRALDSKAILSAALAGMGEGDLARGRTDVADARFREGLIVGHEGAFLPGVAFNLQGLARVAVEQGDLGRAVRLAAALEAFPGSIGGMPPGSRARYEAAVSRARRSLDAATVDVETARGRRMDPGAIIAELP